MSYISFVACSYPVEPVTACCSGKIVAQASELVDFSRHRIGIQCFGIVKTLKPIHPAADAAARQWDARLDAGARRQCWSEEEVLPLAAVVNQFAAVTK